MEENEVEKHHVAFAIGSIILASIYSILITETHIFNNNLISLFFFSILLLFTTKRFTILATLLCLKIMIKEETYKGKKPVGAADLNISASIIITGFLIMEIYSYLINNITLTKALNADQIQLVLMKIIIIAILSFIIFNMSYYINKTLSSY